MNEVNRTLFIPLYGKSRVSRQNIILEDPAAERIWDAEGFPVSGKSGSRWLAYNMAMRARVFDDWTDSMLQQNRDALVLHIGCGLDSRCMRIKQTYREWIDCDLPEVIAVRRRYYEETDCCHMAELDASDPKQVAGMPDSDTAIVVLEGLSMYLTNEQLHALFQVLQKKYTVLHILMDVYTPFGAKASKYGNPVNDVGVTTLYGVGDVRGLLDDLSIRLKEEHSITPRYLTKELKPAERVFFRLLFSERIYRQFYRLFEFERV